VHAAVDVNTVSLFCSRPRNVVSKTWLSKANCPAMFRSQMRTLLFPSRPIVIRQLYGNSGSERHKTGILMLNMGGPKTTEHVHDFLLRLFSDREIMQLPAQSILSRLIAKRRSPKIVKQYEQIGGGSPITHWTQTQGDFVVRYLDKHRINCTLVFVTSILCSKPQSTQWKSIRALSSRFNLDYRDNLERVVAFSQYPQYSCTTSGSSFNAIARHYESKDGTFTGVETISAPDVTTKLPGPVWSFLDRWPVESFLTHTFAQHIRHLLDAIEDPVERKNTVLLFSAHSIPISVVSRGDSYPQEVAATVHAVMQLLNFQWPYRLVWQSKVGPAAWLGPSTLDTLHGLARLGYRHAMLIPIAFTSDHIETLYEMDLEYCKETAHKAGMVRVHRAASPNDNNVFLLGLGELVSKHLRSGEACSRQFMLRCPMCTNPHCEATRTFIQTEKKRLEPWTTKNFVESTKTKVAN
ncbi:ferrochelatase, partial [Opisthorchis viverrini]